MPEAYTLAMPASGSLPQPCPERMKSICRLLLPVLLLSLLAACGNKGPLVRPDTRPDQTPEPVVLPEEDDIEAGSMPGDDIRT